MDPKIIYLLMHKTYRKYSIYLHVSMFEQWAHNIHTLYQYYVYLASTSDVTLLFMSAVLLFDIPGYVWSWQVEHTSGHIYYTSNLLHFITVKPYSHVVSLVTLEYTLVVNTFSDMTLLCYHSPQLHHSLRPLQMTCLPPEVT